jgi:exodeoxyribonuclease V alpha subunit
MSHFIMLQRNLIYTAMTRAKQFCLLIGEMKALGTAIGNEKPIRRNTRLAERIVC